MSAAGHMQSSARMPRQTFSRPFESDNGRKDRNYSSGVVGLAKRHPARLVEQALKRLNRLPRCASPLTREHSLTERWPNAANFQRQRCPRSFSKARPQDQVESHRTLDIRFEDRISMRIQQIAFDFVLR